MNTSWKESFWRKNRNQRLEQNIRTKFVKKSDKQKSVQKKFEPLTCFGLVGWVRLHFSSLMPTQHSWGLRLAEQYCWAKFKIFLNSKHKHYVRCLHKIISYTMHFQPYPLIHDNDIHTIYCTHLLTKQLNLSVSYIHVGTR